MDALIETHKPAEHDRAVQLLEDLLAVAEHSGNAEAFKLLRQQHHRKPGLMERFDHFGL